MVAVVLVCFYFYFLMFPLIGATVGDGKIEEGSGNMAD